MNLNLKDILFSFNASCNI